MTRRRLLIAALVWLIGSAAVFAVQSRGVPPFAGTYVYYLAEREFGLVSADPRIGGAIAGDTRRFATTELPDGVKLALPAGMLDATRDQLTARFWAERWERRRAALFAPVLVVLVPSLFLAGLGVLTKRFPH